MRKLVAAGVVVAAVLAPAATRPADADGEGSGGLEQVGAALSRILERAAGRDSAEFKSSVGQSSESLGSGEQTPVESREDIIAEFIETRDSYADLLSGGNLTWRERLQAIQDTDPEGAGAQAAAGQQPPSASDDYYASQLKTTAKLRGSIGVSIGLVRKAYDKAGLKISLGGRYVDVPEYPSADYDDFVPFFLPVALVWGDCDGTVSLVVMDPGSANEPPIDTSYIQIVDPDSGSPVAEIETTGADFDGLNPAVFQFSGLSPGNYVVRVGVRKDGARGLRHAEAFTIPAWDPNDPPPPFSRTALKQAKSLGLSLRRFVKQEGSTLLKEVKDIVKQGAAGEIDEDESWELFKTQMRATYGRIGALKREHRDEWMSWHDGLRMTDPRSADVEFGAKTGSSTDRVVDDEQAAVEFGLGYLGKAAAAYAKGAAKFGVRIAYVAPPFAGVPHLAAAPRATEARTRSYFRGMSLLATCRGDFGMYVVDPRDGDEIDRVFVEIREIDTRTLVLRRELVDDDFDEDWVALVEADGLLRPGRTYDVRLVSEGDPPFALLDAAVITAPDWGDASPPLPCTGTTASVLVNGLPVFVPPLDRFRTFTSGTMLLELSVSFRNPLSSTIPSVNLDMSPPTPIDLAGPDGVQMTVTLPPNSFVARAYIYNFATQQTTQMASGTYTIRGLRNLRTAGGCAEVVFDGMTAAGQSMSGRFTLGTDQLQ